MADLKFPRLWWTLGWLLVAGVCFGSLMPGDAVDLRDFNDKQVHAFTYGVLMLWFSGLFVRSRNLLIVAGALLLLGAGLDVAQGVATRTRSFDLWDIAANTGGILVGLILARLFFAGWCGRVERLIFH